MPLGIMVVVGAFIDWSAVFMRSVLEASPLVTGLTYVFFSIWMASVRLSGDWLGERYGDFALVCWSGIAAAFGIVLFALAPSVPIAMVGAMFGGMGVALVYPLAVSEAARRPGRSAADNVAAITMISFTAFLVLPPFVGILSDAIGLRWALLVLVPVAITTALLAGEVRPRDSGLHGISADPASSK
jgi:MFS family permease